MATLKNKADALRRRTLLTSPGALAAPGLALAQGRKVLKFIPQSDLGTLDPVWFGGVVVLNHGHMVFDTLYGMDAAYQTQPQMAEGHVIEDDGKTWRIRLRDGLTWHDGEKVLARDCVASIRRWGVRDNSGVTLMAVTEGLDAPDDRTIRFRLRRPFPLLSAALGKPGSTPAFMMPERIARTGPFKQVAEIVGSGPFRFVASDRVSGSLLAYEKNEAYVPRPNGVPGITSGPKIVHVDRVEWHILPDAASAAAAMRTGEFDWWENPSFDLLPLLRQAKNLTVTALNPLGGIALLRFNQLHPPFDNPALRRAILGAIDQEEFMTAIATTDRRNWSAGVGMFSPGTPMASQAGMEALTGPRDIEAARRAVAASGYRGERAVVPIATDNPVIQGLGDVGVDLLQKLGINVDAQHSDFATVMQKFGSMEPVEKGGWSAIFLPAPGGDLLDPAVNSFLRGNGHEATIRGWPVSPRIEVLREEWLVAEDTAARKRIAEDMQRQAFIDVPYIPLGQFFGSTVFQNTVTGVLPGPGSRFWNLKKA